MRSPPPAGFKEKGDSLKWFWESRTQDSEKIQGSQWLDPRNEKLSVLCFTPSLFHSLFSDGLSLKTFSFKDSALSEGVLATCHRLLYPEGISNKERKDWRHQSLRMFSEWPTLDHMYSHRSALLAGRWGCMTGFEWSCGLTNSTHDCQFPPEIHDWS